MLEQVLRLMALMAALTNNREREGRARYARAIIAATDDLSEQRLLAVVAYGENWYHLDSYPPFGLTHMIGVNRRWCWTNRGPVTRQRWGRPDCEHLTIEHAARAAIVQLRWIRQHRCHAGASDADVLKRYGWGGACVANAITLDRMARAVRATRTWGIR